MSNSPPEPIETVTLSDFNLDVDAEAKHSNAKSSDLLSKFSSIPLSSLSSLALSDIKVKVLNFRRGLYRD